MEKDEAPSYDILPTDLNAAGTDSELVFDDDSGNGGKGVGDASPGQLSGDSAGTSEGSANLEKAVDVTVPGEVDKAAPGETHAPEKELEELEEELSATSEQIVADGWTVDGSGAVLYYEGGSALTGWLVDDGYRSYGLQRYWFDSAGRLVVGSLADVGGGEWAYARPEGFVVRGKYVAADGSVYLADNDGRLERAGWVVTDSYDGGMQRYWVNASTHAAATGFFEVDGASYYGLPGDGRELRGAAAVGGELVLADNDGRLLERGWAVTDAFGQGLQRYWFEGRCAARSLLADVGGGEWAYARPEGFVVRGKYVAADGSVYLADNDGRLERAGWVVTDSYDGGMQRYWVDASTHAAATGFFEADGKVYYAYASSGAVARGKIPYGSGVLLSDNEGILVENITGEGWFVTGLYDGGELQRYRIDYSCGGHLGAHVGSFSIQGDLYYGLSGRGYVARNGMLRVDGQYYDADNDGVLTVVRFTDRIGALLQNPELPAGCESVALTIALRSMGYDLGKTMIADWYLPRSSSDFVWSFRGNPYSGGGVYAPGLVCAANNYLSAQGSRYAAHDISGSSFEELLGYVNGGVPVLVWTTMYMASPSWSGQYYAGHEWYWNEHCVVLYGASNGNVMVSDPLIGCIERGYDGFRSLYYACGSMAVVIV